MEDEESRLVMKGVLLFLNVLIFVCIALLVAAHVRHRSPPPPTILASRPTQPSINPEGLLAWHDERGKTDIAAISQMDLFDPDRGQVEATPEKATVVNEVQRKKLEQFELVGLVRMGPTMHGAIIHDRTGKLKKQFFKVGGNDDIEGFKLVGVDPATNTATFSAGGREYQLKLDRNSKASEQRRAQAQRQEATVTLEPTARPLQPGQTETTREGSAIPADRQAAIEQMRQRMEELRRERAGRQQPGQEKNTKADKRGNQPAAGSSLNRRQYNRDTSEAPPQ
jgi:hypothetical protein